MSCIETENSRISRRYIAKTGILSLEYILSSSAHVPETVSTSQCLLMIKLNQHPQWKVSDSSIHPMIWKAVSESVDGYIHGVLACGPQFILFQVYRNGEIHYLIGNDEAPQDFRELLNNAVVRERFEGCMNGIVHKDLISLVQSHGKFSGRKTLALQQSLAVLVQRTAIRYNARRRTLLTHMCQILQDQWLVKTIYTGFWVLLLDKAEGTIIARRFSSK